MPTSTFFRLPEEKRQRLIEAAWEEFTQNSFSDVSINQIIRAAGIPRGSFYQYFADKGDLFFFLLDGTRQYFSGIMEQILKEEGGDLFALSLRSFDWFTQGQGSADPSLGRCLRVMRVNQGLDVQQIIGEKPRCLTEGLWAGTDLTGFRRKERDFVEQVFFLLAVSLTSAVMEVLQAPDQWEEQRAQLQTRIEILRSGSVTQNEANEACVQQGGDQC